MRTLLLLASALCLSPGVAAAQEQGGDPLVFIEGSDAAMNAAITRARAELPGFFQRLARPGDDERNFSIKYNLTPDGEPEFIWAAIESRRDGVTVARLANNPHDPRFKLGQRVEIRDADVIDWAYVRGTVMQGHYTTRVLLDHLDPAQAASVRAAMGWN